MAVCVLLSLCLVASSSLAADAVSSAPEESAVTTANLAGLLMTTASMDGAALLQVEGQRLGELSKQVAETNRALEELLATKLRDIHYASVIGELRAEIDALR